MENNIRTGTIINPKSGRTYNTRDTVNALRLAKLVRAIDEWKRLNEKNKAPAAQRHVKAIKEVL